MRRYYQLTKPGIVYGNALVAVAGFLLASNWHINLVLFAATIVGLSCVVAGACVFNNYQDRGIDAKMERTKTRALVEGAISPRNALIFGADLTVLGVIVLYIYTNALTLAVALAGFVIYVALYSPLKHRSKYALYVGALAGATPPVVGYVAVTDRLDYWALGLFVFLFIWQLPHFIAIAMYRFNEYQAAGVPLVVTREPSDAQKKTARSVFVCSLVVLLAFCALISLPPTL